MKPQFTLTKPIRFYFVLILGLSTLFLTVLLWSFYSEGKTLQNAVKEQSLKDAENELNQALDLTLETVQKELLALSEWDEIHQQFQDPSYYFFWQEKRLQESPYYRVYYDQIELYQSDGSRLMPASPNAEIIGHHTLPATLLSKKPKIVFKPQQETHLNLYTPVFNRLTGQIKGYIGLSIDFKHALFFHNQFHYLDKTSLRLQGTQPIPYGQISEQITFSPISNPVDAHLWELIPGFLFQLSVTILAFSGLVILLFHSMIRTPLSALSIYLQRLKNAPGTSLAPPEKKFLIREFEEFKEAIYQYHHNLQKAQSDLNQQNLVVWDQARRDALTNIYNRRAFDEAWNEAVLQFHESPLPTIFMLFDCDFFKALNDTYGHEVGDEVIRISAKTIQKTLPIEYPAYRIGGDEFAVIVQHHSHEEVQQIAQKCLDALNNYPFQTLGIKEKLSFSVGISSTATRPGDDLTSLPRQADMAMYKAKQQSQQSKIQSYHLAMETESSALVSSEAVSTIVEAIHTGANLFMHFQPITSVKENQVYYESLVRIQGEKQLISPREIFSVVERRRLEFELDQQVILTTLKMLQKNKIPEHSGFSINISGKTLLQPGLTKLFEPFEPHLKNHKVVIEITENILIDHMAYAQEVLNRLRDKGFLIALDDFGSGYSSIRYLAHMPVDIIKFDMSMTHALNRDPKTRQIILSTAKMIRQSGYQLVMEGIETPALLEEARSAGATHLQGFLIGKPSAEFINAPQISNLSSQADQ